MSEWHKVQQLFLTAVALPVEEQSRFVEENCAGDKELDAELRSLLAADTDSGVTIESAVHEEVIELFDSEMPTGSRFGSYVVEREIGRGGMGSVYLARRNDDEYQQEVALKIVKRGMDTAEVLKRFRYERQILASLEHPYIARLFDGGSTASGVPFFVMEYIHGKPLDVFCRENLRDYRSRCELFLRILDAVAYAHRSLVVHRDLKPANILVTPDGTPKLLDFGVAKLLSGDPQDGNTGTSVYRPFTPAYASPEQVRGLPITTATDIYSLGTIFYELLSGCRAQQIEVHTPEEIERVVCRSQIKRGALHVLGLDWDLDNIVAMATRKEPERRYHSAQEFAEDIRRHLEGRPVVAGPDSLAYRGAKFVRRNAWQLAASFIVASSLIVGLGVSIAQSHRARVAEAKADAAKVDALGQTALAKDAALAEFRQRTLANQASVVANEQRDRAEHLRALADERTAAILELANRTLFDIHDSIATLPGSLDARRTLVKTTLDYLEKLEKQEGPDDKMRAALCAAYFKVALMQGNPQGASLQEFDLAEKTLMKGQMVLMPAYERAPNDTDLMMRYVEVRSSLADLMFRSGRQKESIEVNKGLLPIAHRLYLAQGCASDLSCRMAESGIEHNLTYELIPTDTSEALEHANKGIAQMRELLRQNPDNDRLKQDLGSLMASAAGAYRTVGDLPHAAEYYRESIGVREDLLRADPHNAVIRRNLLIAYGNYATVLGIPWSANLGRPDEARIYARKCVELARETVGADANDATGRHDLGMSLGRLGMIDPGADHVSESLANLKEAESFLRPIALANPKSSETAAQLALVLEYEGIRLEALGRGPEALTMYRGSRAVIQPFFDGKNSPPSVAVQYLSAREDIALLEMSLGQTEESLDETRLIMDDAKAVYDRPQRTDAQTTSFAKAWATQAIIQSKAGKMAEARESAKMATGLWKTLAKPTVSAIDREMMAKTQAVLSLPITH
jgi:eukaryotic-like serine/threonine-protein kinase